jgi:hypothetical protein
VTDEGEVKRLNGEVTMAILAAEAADRAAAVHWKRVAELEAALYAVLPAGTLGSSLARRGIRSARAKVRARRGRL